MRELDIDTLCGDEVIEGLDSGKLKLWTSEASDRATACYNALAGRDPEKLEELLKCYSLMYQRLLLSDEPINGFLAECHDALAAFEGGE